MGKDTTAFKLRFEDYKNGKPVSEIYDAGLPRYAGGKPMYQTFIEEIGPVLFQEMVAQGVKNPEAAYKNMITLLAYESNYGQSRAARELNNFGGVGWNGKTYTTYKDKSDFVRNYVRLMNSRYKNVIAADTLYDYAKGLKGLNYYEDSVENYTRNLTGMKSFAKALDAHMANNPDLYVLLQVSAKPMSQTTAAELNAASQFLPPTLNIKSDYSLNNPAPSTISSWNNSTSPAFNTSGLYARRATNNINNVVQDILFNDKDVLDALTDNLSNNVFGGKRLGFKNGKLPGYKWGTQEWDKDDSTEKAEQWADDWLFRLTPAAGSKVVLLWNATGNKPEPESAELYTLRRMKETEWKKPSGRKMLEMAPTAVDFVPGAGDVKLGLEAVNAAINKDYLTAGILGSLLIAPSAAAKLIKRSVNKANDLAPIVNDIAKSPYLPDELDAWTSIMEHRNYKDRRAERMFEQNLPDLIAMKDEWVKYGAKGEEPKLWDWDIWKKMDDSLKFSNLFEKRIDPEFNQEYYIVKPWYKDFVSINGGKKPYGYDFHGELDGSFGMYSSIPNEIKSKNIPIIRDMFLLEDILGLKPTPAPYNIIKPKKPAERVNWDDYRDKLKERILNDWNSDGPLRSHLQRSGITDPTVLLDYMLSPELAWKLSLSKPGLDLGQYLFNAGLKDDIMRDPVFLKGFLESLNKVLKRYGESPIDIDKSKYLDRSNIIDLVIDHTFRNKRKSSKIFDAAFNDVLKRNPDAAKAFYTELDRTYDNAFAATNTGTMYISPLRKTFGRTVSHELGHLEDLADYHLNDAHVAGIVESTQNTFKPSADTPLFKKAFDLSKLLGSTERYFTHGGDNATEMAQRATLIADYLKLKKGEPITPEKLKYAMENYVKDTGMDNNMTEFFSTIKDIKAAAKWMSAFHKAIIPLGIAGTATYKTLKPRKENK